jgi:hypothetical protein
MKHPDYTPGPWDCVEVQTQCGRAFRIGRGAMLEPGPRGCCIIYDDYGHGANERRANAVLISAAPDMYAALYNIMLRYGPGTMEDEVFEQACAALAKARGET